MTESIVCSLLQSTIAAAIGTIVVVLLRLLLRKAPRRLVCLMWAAVFFRCLCPFAPESSLSLFSVLEISPDSEVFVPEYTDTVLEYTPAPGGTAAQQNSMPSVQSVPGKESAPNPHFDVYTIIIGVWLAGTAAVLGYGIVSGVRLGRRVSAAVRTEKGVYESDRIDTAFTMGLRVYLPRGLPEGDRELILLHERAHLHTGDNLFKPLAFAGLAMQWFNPAVWLAFRLLSRDMEIAADEAVLRTCGRRQDYARTLIRASQRQSGITIIPEFGNTTKERIEKIMDYKKPSKLVTVIGLAAALTACASVATDPVTETYQTANPAAFDSFEDVDTEVNVYTSAETTAPSETDADEEYATSVPEQTEPEENTEPVYYTLEPDSDADRELEELEKQAELLEKEAEQPEQSVTQSNENADRELDALEKQAELLEKEAELTETRSNENSAAFDFIFPVAGEPYITARYDERNDVTYYFHSGVDFKAEEGTEVYAAADGVVTAPDEDAEYGVNVVIGHGDGVETLYAHLSQALVKEGDEVKQGDLIGYVGATGMAFGNHLHFEVRQYGEAVDPIERMDLTWDADIHGVD